MLINLDWKMYFKILFQNFISDSQILLTWLPSSSRMRVCCLRVAADHQFSKCTYFLIFKLYLLPDFQNVPTSWYSDFQIVPTSWFSNCTYFLIFKLYLLPDFQIVPTSWFSKCTYFLCSYFPICILYLLPDFWFYKLIGFT